MKGYLSRVTALCALLFTVGCATTDTPTQPVGITGLTPTALDRYVNAPDDNFRYEEIKAIDGDGYTAYILDMISQKWLTEKEVDRPLWQHWVHIVVPDNVDTTTGFLYIGGGSNGRNAPDNVPGLIVDLAKSTNSVVAQLDMVPNQPITFVLDDDKARTEDSLIAYTWDKYLLTGDEKWPARLPMTKSAVRAMDAITEFLASENGGETQVSNYVVAGGSKRGWTTWTTAVVDSRVIAIAPIVIDLLNVIPSFEHHYEVYGRYANAVSDYLRADIMARTSTPEYKRLMEIVEPYEYRDRLTLPKFLINATGDQFFIPDSSQFYWDDLQGEKYIRYVPNGDHGLGGTDAVQSMVAWYNAVIHNIPRPRFNWRVDEDGAINVFALDTPKEVRLWQATNPKARNFQKAAIGEAWTSTLLAEQDAGVYVGKISTPDEGWSAFFVELTFDNGTPVPFKFTTQVKVLPDVLPFEYTPGDPAEYEAGFLSR